MLDLRPVRAGTRVRSTAAESVFASDTNAGELGRVTRAPDPELALAGSSAGASYLIRWDSGREGWVARSDFDALRVGASLAAAPADTAPPAPGPAWTRRKTGRAALQVLTTVGFAQVAFPALVHVARHPTPGALALTAAVVMVVVALIVRMRRRAVVR